MRRNVAVFTLLGIPALCLLLFIIKPEGLSGTLNDNWVVDSICIVSSVFILALMYNERVFDALSPLTFFSALFISMFFITPLFDMAYDHTIVFGVTDLFDYGIRATLIAFGGFLSFCIVYTIRIKLYKTKESYEPVQISEPIKQRIAKISFILWCVYFVVALVLNIFTTGFSIRYILSFGIWGDADVYRSTSSPLGFLIQFTRGIITVQLIYQYASNNRAAKIIICILTAFLQIIAGFRYMIVVMICSMFYFNSILEKKRISLIKVVVLVGVLALIAGIVGYGRNAVRAGYGFSISGFSLDVILEETIFGNLGIYKSYYAVVKAVPRLTPYIYFDQMLQYTIILLVPRIIWPNKPLNPGTKAQLFGMNQAAVDSGYAYPFIGEYYYSFGILGVLLFCGIFGYWLANNCQKYRYSATTEYDYIWYSVSTPMILQLIIRGYTPTNFYYVIALIFPFLLIKRIIHSRNLKVQN